MDAQCSQLLPHVCGVLVDHRQPLTDSSWFEKLLDWFTSLLNTVSAEQLLEENQCILMLFQHVLSVGDPNPNLLTFSMRFVGLLAGHEPGFKYLLMKNIVQGMFGENIYTHDLWRDPSVRMAWIQGLLSMVQHKQAVFFLSESGIIEVMLNLQMDPSLFVATASNQLVAHIFLVCLKMELENPECTEISNWPESAQTILTFLKKSLMSESSFSVTQAIKALTLVYNGCTDTLAAILWSCIAVAVNSLLDQKTVHGAKHFKELLLHVARFPAFSNPENDLWILMKRALKNLNPLQSGSLALGILKLEHCPQGVSLQAMCVLLQPLDCVLKVSVFCGQSGVHDELVSDPAEIDKLLSTKPSCVALLCQCLCHLHQLCQMNLLSIKIPHESVLNCVVTMLQLCIGQASGASSVGSNLCRFLIGCLKVQRPALDTLESLALWPLNQDSLLKTFNVLLSYLENPETNPTVLKKTLQASLKWLQVSSVSADSEYWHCSCRFLQDLFPVLMKRMCSPSWEIRDSTLEFLALLIDSVKEKGQFQKVYQTSRVSQLVLELLKDPESYVRASAVSCLGKIISITHLYPALYEESWLPMNTEDIVSQLLEILSQDTEAFPRRAVVKVFTEWLKLGHMQHLKDPKQTLSRILEVTRNDLDWEVKVNALDLADVFMDQTFALWNLNSCPYTVDLHCHNNPMTEAIQKCDEVGLFPFLLSSLCDCDRPVALRSCDMLCALKTKLCEGGSVTEYLSPELYDTDWLESILKDRFPKGHNSSNGATHDASWLTDILKKIDLVSLKISLSMGSGHIHEKPQSLLYDIKATLLGLEEHDADCY